MVKFCGYTATHTTPPLGGFFTPKKLSVKMNNSAGKLEWFGGNQDALDIYRLFVDLSHTWDDLVDKDKPVSEYAINDAFMIALVKLPSNPFYKNIQDQVLPFWVATISAYETANTFEKNGDQHGLEIGHTLRYMAGSIISYIVFLCVGVEKSREFMPEVWKSIACERIEDYKKDHVNV